MKKSYRGRTVAGVQERWKAQTEAEWGESSLAGTGRSESTGARGGVRGAREAGGAAVAVSAASELRLGSEAGGRSGRLRQATGTRLCGCRNLTNFLSGREGCGRGSEREAVNSQHPASPGPSCVRPVGRSARRSGGAGRRRRRLMSGAGEALAPGPTGPQRTAEAGGGRLGAPAQ
ncbi:PREDICTED: methyl-CpG-binding domain protein 2-like, partial [Chrysochloris asiatica]|uniref:Methyl-CpG-binding domain protein 2-like n=1 Tax=Chrysochloris asiatica TaxID=185453 RepID=A0A9B0X4C2_CHRAS